MNLRQRQSPGGRTDLKINNSFLNLVSDKKIVLLLLQHSIVERMKWYESFLTSAVLLLQHLMHSKYFICTLLIICHLYCFLHAITRCWYLLAMMAFISTGVYRILRCDVLIHLMMGFTARPSWMKSLCTAFYCRCQLLVFTACQLMILQMLTNGLSSLLHVL